jgi:ubiquinone/menaquinone biosynthesis C-methylase UbiE
VPLRSDIATPEGKRRYARRLFATIADRYDFITRFLSYGQDRRWKARLLALARIRATDRVLDLACGTGDILLGAALSAKRAVGLDLTLRMLQLAAMRTGGLQPSGTRVTSGDGVPVAAGGLQASGARPDLVCGDMVALPFGSAQFDVVTIGYGLRNVPDLPQALREIHRVLAPAGRVLSLDFNRPRNPVVRGAYLTYLAVVGSALGFVLHGDPDTYRYIPESIRLYPGRHGVARLLEQHGFTQVRALRVLGGFMAIHVAEKPLNSQRLSNPAPNSPLGIGPS